MTEFEFVLVELEIATRTLNYTNSQKSLTNQTMKYKHSLLLYKVVREEQQKDNGWSLIFK
jgi:hypothetical protein